ncbi:hypothetical protein [Bacillus suaedae]|uniref:Uncharacterized protein n=1 Tax=Halalkalibacter suaedae TaxID=2822140 RepID=A0A941AQ30_9BACI|nr:hypothetical protein [Bacillus suaedae]MBP3952376.1 hypothetical protein [Bacillus suaedae]
MNLFKAHIVHPNTQVPLIVYFNESDGHVTFEKDNEVLELLLQLQKDLAQDKKFLQNISQTNHLCKTQYPVDTFGDVYEFLGKLGIKKEDLSFQPLYLH